MSLRIGKKIDENSINFVSIEMKINNGKLMDLLLDLESILWYSNFIKYILDRIRQVSNVYEDNNIHHR